MSLPPSPLDLLPCVLAVLSPSTGKDEGEVEEGRMDVEEEEEDEEKEGAELGARPWRFLSSPPPTWGPTSLAGFPTAPPCAVASWGTPERAVPSGASGASSEEEPGEAQLLLSLPWRDK